MHRLPMSAPLDDSASRPTTRPADRPPAGGDDAGLLARFARTLTLWRRRAEDRRHLGDMGEAMARDIGVTLLDAWREAAKPFWKA